jgi:hypothetical protein
MKAFSYTFNEQKNTFFTIMLNTKYNKGYTKDL